MEKTFQNILVQFQLIPGLPGRENPGRQDASRNGLGLESPATGGGIRLRARLLAAGRRFHGLPRDGGSYSREDGLMRVESGREREALALRITWKGSGEIGQGRMNERLARFKRD